MAFTHHGRDYGDHQYVLLSDVHLSELAPEATADWWSCTVLTHRKMTLTAFMVHLDAQRPDAFGSTVLIFNGDTFDFDSVFTHPDMKGVSPLAATHGAGSSKMRRLLADHERFVRGLASFQPRETKYLREGNHDRELAFETVQAELVRQVVDASLVLARASLKPSTLNPVRLYPGVFASMANSTTRRSYRDVPSPCPLACSRPRA